MKRSFMAMAGLALFLAGCTPGRVVIMPNEPIKKFSRLDVQVSSETYLATIKGNKNYDRYVALTSEAEKQIGGHIRNWAQREWKGNPGGRPLLVKLDLQEYNTGSGALKLFLGSAANGKIVYMVSLLDGTRMVGQFLHEGEVSLAGNSNAFWGMSKQIESRIAATE
jgi:hypothetical protein